MIILIHIVPISTQNKKGLIKPFFILLIIFDNDCIKLLIAHINIIFLILIF